MKKGFSYIFYFLILMVQICVYAPKLQALTDEEVYRTLNFNYIMPGARALGFGGAFISLADDATAAEANPAGLTILAKPELFGELRFGRFNDKAYSVEGGIFGSTSTQLHFVSYNSPTFFSFTYPTPHLTLAFSRQEVMNIRNKVSSSFDLGIFWNLPNFGHEKTWGDLDMKLVNWNISVAKKISRTLSAGFSIRICSIKANSNVINWVVLKEEDQGPDFYTLINQRRDVAIGANFGVLWKPDEHYSVGFVYRNQPKFHLEETYTAPDWNMWSRKPETISFTNTINLPDSYGLGISARPTQNFTLSFDLVRMINTDLLEDFINYYNPITIGLKEDGKEVPFTAKDKNEYHLGGEYVFFINKIPFAIRLGYYSDPQHRIFLDKTSYQELNETSPEAVAEAFPEGKLIHHVTAGFGIAIRDNSQLDFAYDYSNQRKEAVMSFIFRFE